MLSIFPIFLSLIVSAALGQLVPETFVRPSVKGYTTIKGICDPSSGTLAGKASNFSGKAGTLRACTQRCNDLATCQGLNFATDLQQCQLFQQNCDTTQRLGFVRNQPNQNYYRKGEIECSMSTVGTEFYVAFMANRVAQPKNMSLEIWLTQDQIDGTIPVTIEIDSSMTNAMDAPWPAGSNTFQIQVPRKIAVPFTIPSFWKLSDIMDPNGNSGSGVTIEKKALKLSSDTNFVLYGVNKEYFTSDAFLGIPSRALSTRYVAICHWPPYYNCEFAITATEDNTVVTIQLPKTGSTRNVGKWELSPMKSLQGNYRPPLVECSVKFNGKTYRNGDTFNITLNEFDVAQIQDPCDLTSTVITATKQIAVWSGDSRSNIGESPNRDHLVEQLFSTDTWGIDCAAWPTPNRTSEHMDYWMITAAQNGTTVRIDSNERDSFSYTLNAGESVRFPALSVTEWMRFWTTDTQHPFQAVQESHSTKDEDIPGDPSMTLCIPSDQFGFGYTFVTPTGVSSSYVNYLTIITKKDNKNGFLLDGTDLIVKWNNVPNSDLVGGWVLLDTSSKQQFRIEHRTKGVTFEAYIYGAGNRESIGYPTGACIKALGDCTTTPMFIGDGKDNDCDGVIDEEFCDGIDNDFDGLIDEDCYARKRIPQDRCPNVSTVVACYGSQLQLSCDDGNNVTIIDAHFGRTGRDSEQICGENTLDSCGGGSDADCGFVDISAAVTAQCNGQQNCSVPVSYFSLGNLFNPSRCSTCSLYAHVQYACLTQREQTTAMLSGSNYAASSYLSASGSSSDSTCWAGSATATVGCTSDCSSVLNKPLDTYHPSQAAFSASSVRGWRPAVCDKDSSWLQIDLGGAFNVGWYAISGCRREDFWVTKFTISHSLDGRKWTTVMENSGPRQFSGNVDAISVKVCTLFAYNITARWLRISPIGYNAYPCAHVDFGHGTTLQGCRAPPVSNSNFANGGTVAFGTPATIQCSRGWSTANGATNYDVQCSADGQWSCGGFRDCSRVLFCPDIPQIDGGYANAKNNLVGATVNFGCLNGRRLNGPISITCLDNGKWSDEAPTCEQNGEAGGQTSGPRRPEFVYKPPRGQSALQRKP